MNDAYATDGVAVGAFVMIDTGNVEDEDNAKLYVKGETAYDYITDLSGAAGIKGDPGEDGADGADGAAATITVGNVTTLEAGEDATVQNTGTANAAVLTFGIPKGEKGDKGDRGDAGQDGTNGADGAAATVTVGEVTTGEPGTDASVSNSGNENAAVLNFIIPRGEKGDTGAAGQDGATPTVTVGSVTSGDVASVQNSGEGTNVILDFVLQKGDKGDKGDAGQDGAAGADGAAAGFGEVTATVDNNTGVPAVEVETSGPDTAKVFTFKFTNLKGEKGDTGDAGKNGADGVGLTGEATAVELIAEPTTADAGTVAAKVNEIITALKARGVIL